VGEKRSKKRDQKTGRQVRKIFLLEVDTQKTERPKESNCCNCVQVCAKYGHQASCICQLSLSFPPALLVEDSQPRRKLVMLHTHTHANLLKFAKAALCASGCVCLCISGCNSCCQAIVVVVVVVAVCARRPKKEKKIIYATPCQFPWNRPQLYTRTFPFSPLPTGAKSNHLPTLAALLLSITTTPFNTRIQLS